MATRLTDLTSSTSESSEMNEAGQKESDDINCVVFYYEKGTSENDFLPAKGKNSSRLDQRRENTEEDSGNSNLNVSR